MKKFVLIGLLAASGGCGSESIGESCNVQALPFTGAASGAVTILAAGLECAGGFVTPLVTVRHATPNELTGVQQTIGVYSDRDCNGSPTTAVDDVFSDQEESFGELIDEAMSPALYEAICGSDEWPLFVSFGTVSAGTTTEGIIAATVVN